MLRTVYKKVMAYALVSTINTLLHKLNYFELNAG